MAQQQDHRTLGKEQGQAYAQDHLFLDDGQRRNAAEQHADRKHFQGQAWQAYCEGFIEGAEEEEQARPARERARVVSKGYEDGQALLKERPLLDFLHYIGFLPENVARAHIAPEFIESYRDGMGAAWNKAHDKPFNVGDEFTKDMYGPSSLDQARMRDLEQS